MKKKNRGGAASARMIFLGLVLVFLYLPVLMLAVYSFTTATQIGAIRGFSLKNYEVSTKQPRSSFMRSLRR